jgi:hypothetical protein
VYAHISDSAKIGIRETSYTDVAVVKFGHPGTSVDVFISWSQLANLESAIRVALLEKDDREMRKKTGESDGLMLSGKPGDVNAP